MILHYAAIMQSMKIEFPNISIYGCYFYYAQCLMRKIQNLGMKCLYENNQQYKQVIKRCVALPLMSLDDIDSAWFLINEC